MFKNTKADMSIALIVAAVIGLILLVVITAIWIKGSGWFANTLESCESKGGGCEESLECDKDKFEIPNAECPETQICCRGLS